jgi:hypothetical protein
MALDMRSRRRHGRRSPPFIGMNADDRISMIFSLKQSGARGESYLGLLGAGEVAWRAGRGGPLSPIQGDRWWCGGVELKLVGSNGKNGREVTGGGSIYKGWVPNVRSKESMPILSSILKLS